MRAHRLRVTFACDGPFRYISHLDLMRAWERVLRRAGVPVAYSEGFSPRPRLALAAPLAVGVSGDAELLDVFLAEPMTPAAFRAAVTPDLPEGLRVVDAREAPLHQPSLQSLLRRARFVAEVADPRPLADLERAITDLLARDTLPWEHQRGEETRRYDLRALVHGISARALEGDMRELTLDLRADESGAGRPEQVLAALGIPAPPRRLRRTALILEEPDPPARAAARHQD